MNRRVLLLFSFLSLVAAPAECLAGPVVSDIVVSGIISFSNGPGGLPVLDNESYVIGGFGIQNGSFFGEFGIDTILKRYVDSLPDTPGPEPRIVPGTLTVHGDGGGVAGPLNGNGFGGTAMAVVPTRTFPTDDNVNFRAAIDLDGTQASEALKFTNNSLTQPYRIDLVLDYAHGVNASSTGAARAFIDSDLDVVIAPGTAMEQVFESEIRSDTTADGNMLNDNPIAGMGGPVSQAGKGPFSFTAPPSQSVDVRMDYTLRGRVFKAGAARVPGIASAFGGILDNEGVPTGAPNRFFLSLDNVTAVPEPNAFLFLALVFTLAGFRSYIGRPI